MNTKFKSLFLVFLQISICCADIKIENLEPILRSNESALLYAVENCGTYIQLDVDFFRPLNPMMVKVEFYKKEGTKFRQLFKSNDIDWCQIVSKKSSKTNPLIRTFLMPLMSKVPFLTKCPIQGRHEFKIEFERKMLMMFPNGIYKLRIKLYSKEDSNIGTVTMTVKIADD